MKAFKKFVFACIFFVPNYILEIWIFELRSWLGRTFTGHLKIDASKTNYMNLGCGLTLLPNYVNVDFHFEPGIDFGSDLRFPLRMPDNCFDGIFCEHTMEHLNYETNKMIFRECLRVLKPGGTLRILVPNVGLFAKKYAERDMAWFDEHERIMLTDSASAERAKRSFPTPMTAISFVTQEYLHVACWDFETMEYYLKDAGFSTVTETAHKVGKDPVLLVDMEDDGRKLVSLYVEATK